jgi:hypothetical protein
MNEEMSLKDTLSRISHEMEGKIDSDSLQLMKDYFGESCDSVERTAQFHLPSSLGSLIISHSSCRETNQRRSRITR